MKKILKGILLFVILCIFVTGCGWPQDDGGNTPVPPPTQPTPSQKILPISFVYQETQEWCWAASAQMILNYNGVPATQSQIVTAVYGYPMIAAGNASQLIYALNVGGVAANYYPYALTWNQVIMQINSGQPIILCYNNSFAGHAVVLYGYDQNRNVYINDPAYGPVVTPYGTTLVYGYSNLSMIWNGTIADIR